MPAQAERFFVSRGFSCLGVLTFLIPTLVFAPMQWVLGSRDLSFTGSILVAVSTTVIMSPLSLAAWRVFRRPLLVVEADGLRTYIGRRPVKALPRSEIRSIEVRESRWARKVVAHMQPGIEIVIEPPVDVCVPLLRDPAFDQRVARLEEWLRGSGSAF